MKLFWIILSLLVAFSGAADAANSSTVRVNGIFLNLPSANGQDMPILKRPDGTKLDITYENSTDRAKLMAQVGQTVSVAGLYLTPSSFVVTEVDSSSTGSGAMCISQELEPSNGVTLIGVVCKDGSREVDTVDEVDNGQICPNNKTNHPTHILSCQFRNDGWVDIICDDSRYLRVAEVFWGSGDVCYNTGPDMVTESE